MEPINWTETDLKYWIDDLIAVDYGKVFLTEIGPPRYLGTRVTHQALEVCFGEKAYTQSDIWAMCHTVFELWAGYSSF